MTVEIRRSMLVGATVAVVTMSAAADPLRLQDRDFLEDAAANQVAASIHFAPGSGDEVVARLRADRTARFDEIDTVLVRLPADALLKAADDPSIRHIEIVDDDITARIASILAAIQRVYLQHGTMYEFGALNVSLGVPKTKLNANRSAELTVRRALEHLIDRRQIPVVMSLGNDGPTPGLVNPWATAKGVIAAVATDREGTVLWPGSSRFLPGGSAGHDVFAAHGYLSVGPWAAGTRKTPAMLEAERQVDLARIVGAGNEHLYRVDSGTSYAAAEITHAVCLVHQAVHLLRAQMSATSAMEVSLPQFIRAYIDTGVDASHPVFARRLADRTPVYGGPVMSFTRERRTRLHKLVFAGVDLDLRHRAGIVLALLTRAAAPVPGTSADETGHGFVSRNLVAAALSTLTFADIIDLFGNRADPRFAQWRKHAETVTDPVFLTDDIARLTEYCSAYDLILMLKVT